MTITIEDQNTDSQTHQLYTVTIQTTQITTLLTHDPSLVSNWISQTLTLPPNLPKIIGLDVEWRPSYSRSVEHPVATLQLCSATSCLIFQLIYAPSIPQTLIEFLKNPSFAFVGVGIEEDVEKLLVDYELGVGNMVDLRGLAVEKLGVKEMKNAGLKDLAKEVLDIEIVKPKKVTMSRWDSEWLSYEQIQYACADAYLSYEIGRSLMSKTEEGKVNAVQQ